MRPATILLAATLLLATAACSTKKAVVGSQPTDPAPSASAAGSTAANAQTAFLQKVLDTRVYARNIGGKGSLRLQYGDKDLSLPAQMHLRKDAVIRLQILIPFLGSEAARVDFTPSHVLILDRMHKEYIQEPYANIDFLAANGLDFYTLQALFWNELTVPGKQSVGDADLKRFAADLSATKGQPSTYAVSLAEGPLTFTWDAATATGRIVQTLVEYASARHGTTALSWRYDDFRPGGVKAFPARQAFTLATSAVGKQARKATVTIDIDRIKTDGDWDATTKISSSYKRIDAKDALKKLTNLL